MERKRKRKIRLQKSRDLRQYLGEQFILWADLYFCDPASRNTRLTRKEVQDNYYDFDPIGRKYNGPTYFKKRLKKYCELRGYVFNPHMFDPDTGNPFRFHEIDGRPIVDDKSGGVEYFTIGDADGLKQLDGAIRGETRFIPAFDSEDYKLFKQ